jgi:hypothetical protein
MSFTLTADNDTIATSRNASPDWPYELYFCFQRVDADLWDKVEGYFWQPSLPDVMDDWYYDVMDVYGYDPIKYGMHCVSFTNWAVADTADLTPYTDFAMTSVYEQAWDDSSWTDP